MVRRDILVVIFLLLLSIPNRLIGTANGLFAFTYDQGRDLLEVSKIVWNHNFTLIGPTTGLAGIFYGPWWYYFLTPIFILTGGDAQQIAYIFSFIGITTIVALYFFLKKITGNFYLAFLLAVVASISRTWMFGPTLIWNPTLTPLLMIAFLYTAFIIIENKDVKHFFVLGMLTGLIQDTSAAFGSYMVLFLIMQPILFKKVFLDRRFIASVLGLFLVFSPKIFFELRNNFLMSKSLLNFILSAKISSDKLSFLERLGDRLNSFIELAASAFARDNIWVLIVGFSVLLMLFTIALKNKKVRNNLTSNIYFKFLLALILFSFVFFVIYPNSIWGYYLAGLPVVMITVIALIFKYFISIKSLKKPAIIFLLLIIFAHLDRNMLPPYNVIWEGDGSTYKNPKAVVDYIVAEKPNEYSLHAYTSSGFDYPIDYLIALNAKKGLIKPPEDNQKTMYLIIRDVQSKEYLKTGWYGDKTKDKTIIEKSKTFVGFLVEKHTRFE